MHQGPAPAAIEVHFSPGGACQKRIIDLFRGCRETADICVFTISDDRISDVILDAHKRGIRVRIITDDLKVADDGSDISWLRRQIPVVTDGPLVLMHHKFAVIDGDAVATGSYNWTRSAGKCNFEDLLVIREAAVVGAYQKRFEQLWSQLGSQMTGKPR